MNCANSNPGGLTSANTPVTITQTAATGPSATVSFVKTDLTTQGNWVYVYGADGETINSDTPHLAAYAQVNVTGVNLCLVESSTDPRALPPAPPTPALTAS